MLECGCLTINDEALPAVVRVGCEQHNDVLDKTAEQTHSSACDMMGAILLQMNQDTDELYHTARGLKAPHGAEMMQLTHKLAQMIYILAQGLKEARDNA